MRRLILVGFALLFALAAHAAEPLERALHELPNARFPTATKVVSGAVEEFHFASLRDAGIRHIVNLRPAEENPEIDEPRLALEHGIAYHAVPIKGAQSLTVENARELDRILAEIGEERALLHCSSGNRVGALIALREAWVKGKSAEEAIAVGREWGLTGLEQPVRALLEK